jgi:hypothetical protein
MKYLMLIHGNEEIWNSLPPADIAELIHEVDMFNTGLRETGELVAVDGLVPEATSIRVLDGSIVMTDGPYLEAKEFVGSYFIVDVEDKQRALEISRSYPGLGFGGGVEMWPLMSGGGSDL